MPLPKFEDWRRPWKDGELDEDKAARLVYNARLDEEKAKNRVHEKDEEIATLKDELDEAKAGKAGTDAEAQQELKDYKKQVRELKEQVGQPNPDQQKDIDRLTVAIRLGLSEADSKRLVGNDFAELEQDARTFAEEHGIELRGEGEDGNEDKGGNANTPPGRQPQRGQQQPLRTGIDQGGGGLVRTPAQIFKDL